MANDLNTAIVRVARNLKDLEPTSANQLLTDDEIANQLGAAVTKYSFDRPRLAFNTISHLQPQTLKAPYPLYSIGAGSLFHFGCYPTWLFRASAFEPCGCVEKDSANYL